MLSRPTLSGRAVSRTPRRFYSTPREVVKLASEKQAASANSSRAPLVVLHGLYGTKQNWRGLAKGMALKLERDIFALDLRNHGRSPHSPACNFLDHAADVKAFIEEEQKLTECIVVGHSMGGQVSMTLALGGCAALSKLVVIDVPPGPFHMPEQYRAYLDKMKEIEAAKVTSRKAADQILQQIEPDLGVRQFLLTNLDRPNPPEPYRFRIPLGYFSHAMDEIERFPFAPGSRTFDKPSLFIRGTKVDYITEQHYSLIESYFPKSRIESLDAGHWVQVDKPSETVALIEQFCRE
ncbi:hypothetical protein JCM10207_003817 [Rhodosporidiobolus poonsookiae]